MHQPTLKKTDYKPQTYYDYSLMFITMILVCIGLIMVYSTSSYYAVKQKFGDASYFFMRQLISAGIGFAAMILVSKFDYRLLIKGFRGKRFFSMLTIGYLVCLALQVFVLVAGKEVKGAKRWIEIKGQTIQPSELTKICVIILAAFIVSAAPKYLDTIWGFLRVMVFVLPLIALVAFENLSTAIIMTGITVVICFIVARKKWYFFVVGAGGVLAVIGVFIFGEAFRASRIDAWLNVETHDRGYQILQGLYAIASGGLFGKGLGQSMQKLGFIPESHNDMIFSIICEELGIVGALLIICLYILLLWRLFIIAVNARELFGSLICVGIMVHIAMQVIINIAVVTNTIPSTGIPLPFISYGGTSLMVLMAEMGIALSVSNRIEFER